MNLTVASLLLVLLVVTNLATFTKAQTSANQVWLKAALNTGSQSIPEKTGAKIQRMGAVDVISGETTLIGDSNSRMRHQYVHEVFNAMSWGGLMRLGAIVASYLRVALSPENIGITFFVFWILQVFAQFLRPKPDHKYRLYWEIYDQVIGYIVIILGAVCIYKGDLDKKSKIIYISLIATFGAISVFLNLFIWMLGIMRKVNEEKSHHNGGHATTGFMNGYGVKHRQGV